MYKLITLLMLTSLLVGCGTTGKDIRTEVVIEDNQNCVLHIYPDVRTRSGDTDSTSDNTTDMKDLVRMPLMDSASSTLSNAVEQGVNKGILKKAEEIIKPNDTGAATEPESIEVEVAEDVTPAVETYRVSLRQDTLAGGKRFTWLKRTGSSYISPLIIVFPECDNAVLTVENPARAYGADGDASNHAQMYYFSGNPELQKDTNMSCSGGCASIFAPQGCTEATYALLNQAN